MNQIVYIILVLCFKGWLLTGCNQIIDKQPPTLSNTPDILPGIIQEANEKIQKRWYYSLEEAMQKPDSVKYLSLREQGFEVFPKEILQLQNLEELDISMNLFLNLPDSIGKLKELRELSCSYGYLENLPVSIGNLENLERLWLLDNNIKELPIGFQKLIKLKSLNLALNPMKTLPKELFKLVNLEELSFGAPTPDIDLVFTKTEREEMQKHLPNCYIDFGNSEK